MGEVGREEGIGRRIFLDSCVAVKRSLSYDEADM